MRCRSALTHPISPCTMCKYIVLILSSLSIIQASDAQDKTTAEARASYLGICLGSGIASYREDLVVPIDFHGPGLSLGAEYTTISETSIIDIRFRFGMSFLKNRYSHQAYAVILEIRPAWIKRLSGEQGHGELWGGLSLSMKMNNLFIESWDDSHLYWLTAYGLGPSGEWHKRLSSGREIRVHFGIPVVSLVSRPPEYRYKKQEALTHLTYHLTEPNKSLMLELPDDYRAIFIKAALNRNMRHVLWNISLEFEYNYCRKPKPLYALNTALVFSYQWRI